MCPWYGSSCGVSGGVSFVSLSESASLARGLCHFGKTDKTVKIDTTSDTTSDHLPVPPEIHFVLFSEFPEIVTFLSLFLTLFDEIALVSGLNPSKSGPKVVKIGVPGSVLALKVSKSGFLPLKWHFSAFPAFSGNYNVRSPRF